MAVDPNEDVLMERDQRAGALSFTNYDAAIQRCGVIVGLVPHGIFRTYDAPDGKVLVDVAGIWAKAAGERALFEPPVGAKLWSAA